MTIIDKKSALGATAPEDKKLPQSFFHSFQTRLLVLFCCIFLVSQGVFFVVNDALNKDNAHQSVFANLNTTRQVFENILNERFRSMTGTARLLSQDAGFLPAVATAEKDTLRSMLETHSQRVGADVMAAFGADGKIISSYPDFSPAQAAEAFQAVFRLPDIAKHNYTSVIVSLDGRAYQALIVPVRTPELISYVAVGFSLGSGFARDIKKITGTEVSLVAHEAGKTSLLTSTNILAPAAEDFIRQFDVAHADKGIFSTFIDDREYVSYAVPLPDAGKKKFHVVIQTPLEKEMGAFTRYRVPLFVNMLILLAVSILVSFFLSRQMTVRIRLLSENLLNAAKNPEAPDLKLPKKETQDEIGVAIKAASDLILQNADNINSLYRMAFYDSLTGLPNRTLFLDKLNAAIKAQVVREKKRLVVMAVDLDNFKDVNDSRGHEMGDRLLEEFSKRLAGAAPAGSVVSRTSADEFSVMLVIGDTDKDGMNIIKSIFGVIGGEPLMVQNEVFQVRASVGITYCPEDGIDAGQIVKNADIALNRAKAEGRDTIRYYSEDFDRIVQKRFQILKDLRVAIVEDQLTLHYHPQFDLKTGALIGTEALLRWWKPDKSTMAGGVYIPPFEFIPVAEQSGLIVQIGEWVLRAACKMNKSWQDRGLPPFRVAVNISSIQFHRGNLVATVQNILKETGLDPKWLELEVTESAFMENIDAGIGILKQLHELGVEISEDDFGTGYSSLSYLRLFPIDRLKVDQSFVRNALTNSGDAAITRTIIKLGHSLGLRVIAEGVETLEQENFLKREGCDEVQGYKYSKPIPSEKMWDFAIAHNEALEKDKARQA